MDSLLEDATSLSSDLSKTIKKASFEKTSLNQQQTKEDAAATATFFNSPVASINTYKTDPYP